MCGTQQSVKWTRSKPNFIRARTGRSERLTEENWFVFSEGLSLPWHIIYCWFWTLAPPPPFFSHCKLWPDVVWALAIVMQKCKHATPTIVLLQDTPTVGGVKTNCIKFAANPWLHLCVTNNILSFYYARNTEQHGKDATVQIVFFLIAFISY